MTSASSDPWAGTPFAASRIHAMYVEEFSGRTVAGQASQVYHVTRLALCLHVKRHEFAEKYAPPATYLDPKKIESTRAVNCSECLAVTHA